MKDKRSQYKILSSYRICLREYYRKGVGERSSIAGVIITDNLIDIIQSRYKALGGKMKDLDKIDLEMEDELK